MARWLRVLAAGAFTSVQDPGRAGWAHLGVPRAGWLAPGAARAANRLVGNPEEAAVLECLLGRLSVRAGAAMSVAVTGAACPLDVDGRPARWGEAVSVPSGAVITLGPVTSGVRAYLAVSGALAVEPVLGSRSTDTLSGLGPAPLRAGDVVPVGTAARPPNAGTVLPRAPLSPEWLRWSTGPRADWFAPGALELLGTAAYVVHPDSDRVALRLAGPALHRRADRSGELPSEGLVLGAVQVSADGQPLVFLRDHPTTGGYPVVGVVEPVDIELCAQLRPGDLVRFGRVRVPGRGRVRDRDRRLGG